MKFWRQGRARQRRTTRARMVEPELASRNKKVKTAQSKMGLGVEEGGVARQERKSE